MARIEGLEFDVTASDKNALDSLQSLLDTLTKLKDAVQGVSKGNGLKSLAGNLSAVSTAIRGIDKSAVANITAMASALTRLDGASSISIPKALPERMTALANAAGQIDKESISNLDALTTAISKLGGLQDVKISLNGLKIDAQAIKQKADAMNQARAHAESFGKAVSDSMETASAQTEKFTEAVEQMERDTFKVLDSEKKPFSAEAMSGFYDYLKESIWNTLANDTSDIAEREINHLRYVYGEAVDWVLEHTTVQADAAEYRALAEADQLKQESDRNAASRERERLQEIEEAKARIGQTLDAFKGLASNVFSDLGQAFSWEGTPLVSGLQTMSNQLTITSKHMKTFAGSLPEGGLRTFAQAAGEVTGTLGVMYGWTTRLTSALLAVGKHLTGKLTEGIRNITHSFDNLKNKILRVAFTRAIRSMLMSVTSAIGEGIKNLYQWSQLVDNTFANSMDTLSTSMNYLKNSIAAMAAPLINAIAPAIDFIIDKFVQLINVINQVFAILTGAGSWTRAVKQQTSFASAAGSAGSAAKKAAKEVELYLASFDELHVMNDPNTSGSGGGGGGGAGGGVNSLSFVKEALDERLKDLIDNNRWREVGRLVAERLNGVIETVDEWIKNKFQPWAIKWAHNASEALNGFVEALNWDRLGDTVADGMMALVRAGNEFLTNTEWLNLGHGIGEAVWHWFTGIKWNEIGQFFGNKLNALAHTAQGFVAEVFGGKNGITIGLTISNAVKSWFETVDWAGIGQTVTTAFNGITDAVTAFSRNTSMWDAFGNALDDFFDNLDMGKIGELAQSLSRILINVINKLDEHADEIGDAIGSFLGNIDWGGIIGAALDLAWDSITSAVDSFFSGEHGGELATLIVGGIAMKIGAKHLTQMLIDSLLGSAGAETFGAAAGASGAAAAGSTAAGGAGAGGLGSMLGSIGEVIGIGAGTAGLGTILGTALLAGVAIAYDNSNQDLQKAYKENIVMTKAFINSHKKLQEDFAKDPERYRDQYQQVYMDWFNSNNAMLVQIHDDLIAYGQQYDIDIKQITETMLTSWKNGFTSLPTITQEAGEAINSSFYTSFMDTANNSDAWVGQVYSSIYNSMYNTYGVPEVADAATQGIMLSFLDMWEETGALTPAEVQSLRDQIASALTGSDMSNVSKETADSISGLLLGSFGFSDEYVTAMQDWASKAESTLNSSNKITGIAVSAKIKDRLMNTFETSTPQSKISNWANSVESSINGDTRTTGSSASNRIKGTLVGTFDNNKYSGSISSWARNADSSLSSHSSGVGSRAASVISSALKSAFSWTTDMWNAVSNLRTNISNMLSGITSTVNVSAVVPTFEYQNWGGNVYGAAVAGRGWISAYASGGYVDVGEMFLAREDGPELVGQIGNRTAVANNNQIVSAVSQGVAKAVSGVIGAGGGDINITCEIDGEVAYRSVVKRNNTHVAMTGESELII